MAPTLLGKVVGVYSLFHRGANKTTKQDVMVIENLFYNREVTKIFDLKGSLRSRYVLNPSPDVVLLDMNLLQLMSTAPFYVTDEMKATLSVAIQNDTQFLASVSVMDYSLLVGKDSETGELVVGIIDYVRKYTWDKQLETWVKSSYIVQRGKAEIPTIISPKQYRIRFQDAMWVYFVMVPNKYSVVANENAPDRPA